MPASLQRATRSEQAEDAVNEDCLEVDCVFSSSDAIEVEDKVPDTSSGFDAPISLVLVNPGAQASTVGQTRQWSSCPKRTGLDSLDSWWRDNDGLKGGDDGVGRDYDGDDDKFGWADIDGHKGGEGSDGGSEMPGCAGKPGRHNLDGGGGTHDGDGGAVGHDWDGGGRHDCDGGGGRHGWDGIDVHQGGEDIDGGSERHGCAGKQGRHKWDGGGWYNWYGDGVRHDGDGSRYGWDDGVRHDGDGGWYGWDGSGGRRGSDRSSWDVSKGRFGWDGGGRCIWHGGDDGERTWCGGDGRSCWSDTSRSDWSSNKWHGSGHPATSLACSKTTRTSSCDVPWNTPGGESVGDAVSQLTFSAPASGPTPLVAARFGYDAFSETTGHQLVRSDITARSPDNDMSGMLYLLEKAREVDELGDLGEAAQLVKQQTVEVLLAKTTALAQAVACDAQQQQHANATLPPAMALLQQSRNVLLKHPQVNPRFSLTKLTRFHSSATTQVDENECENWLTHQLNMSKDDVPEHVKQDLIALTKGLRKQILTNTKFICENGKGTVYKVTYMMKRDGGQAYIALIVFGASFDVDSEMTTTDLKEGDAGGLVTAAGESFAVPASRSGTPSMSGEDIRTFIDYLEGLAAQQIWDQASPAQRMTVESSGDVQDAAKAITSASVGLAQEAARAAKLTLLATQERASQVKADLDALQSTCRSAAMESKSNLVAAQESASQFKTDLDALHSSCKSAAVASMEARCKVSDLEVATHNVEAKVAILGRTQLYNVELPILGKTQFKVEPQVALTPASIELC